MKWTCFVAIFNLNLIVLMPSTCYCTFGTLQQSLASLLTGGGGLAGRLTQQPQQQQQQQQQQQIANGIFMNTQTGGRITQTGNINGFPTTFGTSVGTSLRTNFGTNVASSGSLLSNNVRQQPQSARILDGLFSGLGGGGQGGVGGGLPGIPPGMTVTNDGCLCPMPKPRTKYVAVEVPQVIFVPPKEKTKIITIKEVVAEKSYEDGGGYEENLGGGGGGGYGNAD